MQTYLEKAIEAGHVRIETSGRGERIVYVATDTSPTVNFHDSRGSGGGGWAMTWTMGAGLNRW